MDFIYNDKIDRIIEETIKPNLKQIIEMKFYNLPDRQIARAYNITHGELMECVNRFDTLREQFEDANRIMNAKLRKVVIERALGTDGREDKDGYMVPANENLAFKILEKTDVDFKPSMKTTVEFRVEDIIKKVSNERKEKIEAEA